MDIQRLRNLTTGKLHTQMEHIYEDIGALAGIEGVMTHQLPNAVEAMKPWLRKVVADPRFWDGAFDTSHTGEIEIPVMTQQERDETLDRFGKLPSPLLAFFNRK